MNASPALSVVVPAFNEGDQITASLESICEQARTACLSYEIIVVDDGSTDRTWPLLEELSTRIPELEAVSLARNFGKEAAILAGLELARGDAAIIIDADLQHPPSLIPEMVRLWREGGFKVVNAVKSDRSSQPVANTILARAFYRLFEMLGGGNLQNSSDFKLLDREVVDLYCRLPERRMFFRGLIPWMGFPQTSVEFEVGRRAAGTSKWSTFRLARMAADAMVSFSSLPLQFVTLLGAGFSIFAAILFVQTIFRWLSGHAIEGFTTVILLLLIVSSILMLSLGIIGQYVAKIYEEIKGRPRYFVRHRLSGTRGAGHDRSPDTD